MRSRGPYYAPRVESAERALNADPALNLTRFPLDHTATAHQAVEGGAVGWVPVDVAP